MSLSLGRAARRSAGLVAAGVLGATGVMVPVAPAANAEGEGFCSEIQADTTDVDEVTMPSAPLEELRIEEATQLLAQRGREPGEGIGVAVVDSGIADRAPVNEVHSVRNPEFSRSARYAYFHGTAVAGLIAGQPRPEGGLVGIAPGAALYDVRVHDTPENSDDGEFAGLTDAGVIDGLNWVADNVDSGPVPIRIVNVSLALSPSDALEDVIGRLAEQGVVVVAASGNRPDNENDPVLGDFAERLPGEDAARVVFPAGYESVVAATTSVPRGEDPLASIVQNSATDIAVPTAAGVSYGLNGVSCLLPEMAATSWAAAEVSGVLALLMSAYDGEPAEHTVARLYRTATGAANVTTRLTGHGVAQPIEALQRPLTFDRNGDPESSETNNSVLKARAPRPEADVLADTRRDAVWWGLAGGGALVLAMLLRPVLARRRTGER